MLNKNYIALSALVMNSCVVYSWVDIETLHKLTNVDRNEIQRVMNRLDSIENEAESSWKHYYHVFPNLIRKFNLKKGCEIGVSTGGHSHKILETTHVEKLYSIDPYTPNTTLNLWVEGNYYYDIMFLRVKHRLGQYGDRSEMIRAYSSDVADRFKDNELDFVFVDGSHEYQYVKEDLELYYKKIRSGGIMAGDDYNTGFPGVARAVNEFFAAQGLKVTIDAEQPRIWWIQKP